MKKLFTIILIVLSTYSVAAKAKLQVKIGTYENSPKIFTAENGEISGFWADITENIAQRENWEIQWIHGTWDQCLQRLEDNEIDMMVDVGVTPARQEKFVFSRETVLLSWTRIYTKSGSDIQTILDLEGKTVAGLKGSYDLNGPEGLKAVTNKFEIDCNIIEMEDYVSIFQGLENNEIDAGVVDKDFGNIHDRDFNIEKTSIILQPAYMQFAFSKESELTPYLIKKIDAQIKELKEDNNSIYYRSMANYLSGQEKITTFPLWLKILLASVFFLLVIFFIFINMLRHQVKKKTAQLQKSETQFRLFAENVPGFVSIYEWYPDGHRRYLYQGPGLENIVGEALAQKIDENSDEYFKLIPEKDFQALNNAFVKALENNENLDFEYRLKIDDSHTKWVRALFSMLPQENGVILWQEIIYDVTEQKQAENALQESENLLQTLINAMPDFICFKDRDGRWLKVNDASIRIFQLEGIDYRGKKDSELAELNNKLLGTFLTCKKSDAKAWKDGGLVHGEERIPDSDGSIRIFDVTKLPLFHPNGEREGLVIIGHDITERKKADLQIKQDLNEKNVLLQEIYHRTKNNMQVIISMLKMQSRQSQNEFVIASFRDIINKISAMSLVHEKLYQAKDLSHINLKEYIDDLIPLLRRSYSRQGVNISMNLALEDVYVPMNTAMPFGLILNELISNAFKHAFPNRENGEISIKLHKEETGAITVDVADNGIGIPADVDLRKSESLGISMMFSLIDDQLKGNVIYRVDNGLKWQLKFNDSGNRARV